MVTSREAERAIRIEVSGRLASKLAPASGEELPAAMHAADGAGEAIRTPDPNLGKLPSRLFYAFRFYAKMPSNI